MWQEPRLEIWVRKPDIEPVNCVGELGLYPKVIGIPQRYMI
jgi:hypothetical protein